MKKWLCLLLCGVMLCSLCGCNMILDLTVGPTITAEQEAIARLGFARGELFEDEGEILYLTVDELREKPLHYAEYRSSLHHDTLTENEQVLYRAYEFAMENGYNNILVDDLLIADQNTLRTVLEFLALDSPLLEQNLRYSYGDFTSYYTVSALNGLYETQAKLDGYYVAVESFEATYWDKKTEALEKAKEIVATLPKEATDEQNAVTLYRYVLENVAYGEEMYPALESTVYDALVGGKSQCDGMANALSMLYQLAGIPCAEKMYRPEEELGHTWVFFELDGNWYNADATPSPDKNPTTEHMIGGYFFAYADNLNTYPTDYASVYPEAADGLYVKVDAVLENCDGDALYRAALSAFNQHYREWCLLIIQDYDEQAAGDQLQDIVDYYMCRSHYYAFELPSGATAFLACLEED